MTRPPRNAPPARGTAYSSIADHHPTPFDPFNPDPAGALREAYAWITAWERTTADGIVYSPHQYDELTAMLLRAIQKTALPLAAE